MLRRCDDALFVPRAEVESDPADQKDERCRAEFGKAESNQQRGYKPDGDMRPQDFLVGENCAIPCQECAGAENAGGGNHQRLRKITETEEEQQDAKRNVQEHIAHVENAGLSEGSDVGRIDEQGDKRKRGKFSQGHR